MSDKEDGEGQQSSFLVGLLALLVLSVVIFGGGLVIGAIEGWDYMKGSFFCATLITTVGYGSYAPATMGGKAFVVLYALVTIALVPFCLNYIANAIVLLVSGIFGCGSEYSRRSRVSIALLVLTVHLFVCGGIAFSSIEGWSFWDAVYFSVVSLTTIGLGDFTPKSVTGQGWSFFFLLTGLGIITILAEEAIDEYADRRARKTQEAVPLLSNAKGEEQSQ